MKFVGLDLSGVNSIACVRDEASIEEFQASAFPERPSVVLLPLVRKERLLAGNEALRSERGSGLSWPPLAAAATAGWRCAVPPASGGRVLVTTVWQRLVEGGQWPELQRQWQPPDGLPPLSKPAPPECLTAEARAVLKCALGDENGASIALAIPNQLPEESQEALLARLPSGARLVWRAVAAAMAWAEDNSESIGSETRLTVLDVGVDAVEISIFEFRRQEAGGRVFQVPIRRLNRLHTINTGSLMTDSPAPFARIFPDLGRLEHYLSDIFKVIEPQPELAVCGPLADTLVPVLQRRFPQFTRPKSNAQVVARGSALFAWRLVRGWPTYLDVLPSLELFITNRHCEPEWLPVIRPDFEAAGGQEYIHRFERILAVRAGTGELENWLRRSNETALRKLTTKLAHAATSEVPVDLSVMARSAGGFARLEVSPCDGRSEVFGESRRLLLDWLSMKREDATPSGFPLGTRFGWPDTGELFGCRAAFQEFLRYGAEYCRIAAVETLDVLESVATKPTPVNSLDRPEYRNGVETGTIPIKSLPCFGSGMPCHFFEGGTPSQRDMGLLEQIGARLWQELSRFRNSKVSQDKRKSRLLTRILGRMGSHCPSAFAEHIAETLKPRMDSNQLFAAGRVFRAPRHAKAFFETVRLRAELGHSLKTPWLRVLDYLLFQRSNILEATAREDLLAAMRLSLESLLTELETRNFKVKFGLSVRSIARLLRARRHYPNFVSSSSEGAAERSLAARIGTALDRCVQMLPDAQDAKGLRRDKRARLCELTKEWLLIKAVTNVLGPPEDDEEEGEEEN